MPDKITLISVCWMALMGVLFAALFTLSDNDTRVMPHTASRVVTAHS